MIKTIFSRAMIPLIFFLFVQEAQSLGEVTGFPTIMGVNAAPIGMAEAYTSLLRGMDSVQYNPAGITSLERNELGFSFSKSYFDDYFSSVSFGRKFPEGYFGFNIMYYSSGEIELIDLDGNERKVIAEKDYMFTTTFANKKYESIFDSDFVSYGFNVKLFHTTLVEQFGTLSSFLYDLGLIYGNIFRSDLSLGASIQNTLFPHQEIRFRTQESWRSSWLPYNLRYGISYEKKIIDKKFTIAVDNLYNDFGANYSNLGFEYQVTNSFVLRTGYRFNSDIDSLTFGFSILQENLIVDYGTNFTKDISLIPYRITMKIRI